MADMRFLYGRNENIPGKYEIPSMAGMRPFLTDMKLPPWQE
jgi:hypothetical protein